MQRQDGRIRRRGAVLFPLVVWTVLLSSRLQAGNNEWTSLGPAGTYVNSVAVDPSTPTTLYAGANDGIYKSTDGGANWSPINTGVDTSQSPFALTIDPSTPTTLYAGAGNGIYKTTDGGEHWSLLVNTTVYAAVVIDPSTPTTLYAGTYDADKILKSTDGGANWSASGTGLAGVADVEGVNALIIDPSTPATLYAGTEAGIFKSTDGGANWSASNTDLPTGIGAFGIQALAIDPISPATLYAASSGVFKSTDGGAHWSAVGTGLPTFGGSTTFLALAVDPDTPTTVYVGTSDAGIFKSDDGGAHWSAINTGLSDLSVSERSLAVDPVTPTTLYVGTNGGDGVLVMQQTPTAECGDGILDDGEDCDLGTANGTAGACCTASCTFVSADTTCRPSAGVCDVAETCTGSSASCPADSKSTAVCRPAADVCDVAESCDGVNNACPSDGFASAATVCRASADQCDAAENCTGSSATCPTNGFQPNSTTCDDGNASTSGDVCTNGICAGSPVPLAVLTPNGSETWSIGSTQTIQWNPSGVSGKVKIELSRDNGATWTVLFSKTPNDGTEPWIVTGPTTGQARVRVSSVSTPGITDTSNAAFTISSSGGSVTVLAPNGGETWSIGSKRTIQWSSSGLAGTVKIELSRDGGGTWTVLSNNVKNTGSLTWKVAKPATTQARIRVSGVSDPSVVDTSNANFTIQ